VLVLWLAMAVFGAAGAVGYVVIVPDVSTRADRAGVDGREHADARRAFLVQAAIGWILDLWPRTASAVGSGRLQLGPGVDRPRVQ
jgi:hypothetical protein